MSNIKLFGIDAEETTPVKEMQEHKKTVNQMQSSAAQQQKILKEFRTI